MGDFKFHTFNTFGTKIFSAMAELENPNTMPNLLTFLSSLLEEVAESNDASSGFKAQQISVFQGLTRPSISIQSYLDRIYKYANCSPSCFIVAYVYLDRFAQRQPSLPINSFNVHRLLITSVMVAAKFMDDLYYNNAYYAKVGGISTIEMNFLEVGFLFGLGFNLNVTPNTFHAYFSYLQRKMMLQQPPPPSILAEASHSCFGEEENSHQNKQLALNCS
ncbi:Cyclin-U4-3 [Hibiscus syriacus]|uniref:Cyclin n=1 Tax=Hibiscus syriacus TaxID=106335 RepID=A0A6A2Y7A3_HIBSY|nr:cyclin-U4-1-like [Hibiscus syriacus]KAE8677455.1 Cyclin-U4-3 [Hibiscus syriacus]